MKIDSLAAVQMNKLQARISLYDRHDILGNQIDHKEAVHNWPSFADFVKKSIEIEIDAGLTEEIHSIY